MILCQTDDCIYIVKEMKSKHTDDRDSISDRWLFLQMNKSRREADDSMAHLEEAKKENHLVQREGELELEKARPECQ